MTKAEIYDKLENHSCADGYCSTCDYLRMELDRIKHLEDQEPMVAWHLARENGKKGDEIL